MLSAAGATNVRKSEGVIWDGTASTARTVPSEGVSTGVGTDEAPDSAERLGVSRKMCTVPSGSSVEPVCDDDDDGIWTNCAMVVLDLTS